MQFTPQQLVGGTRYAPSTRIGNWNEDLMLEEARLKEYLLRKQQGSLLTTHKLKHDFLHLPRPRSYEPYGRVCFNHAVGVHHGQSNGLIAVNVFEETPCIGSDEYIVTVVPTDGSSAPGSSKSAIARTTFRIVSPAEWKAQMGKDGAFDYQSVGASLRYGEPFFLMCNESLLADDKSVLLRPPMFLKSGVKTENSMSPISYNQRLWMSAEPDSSALWVCQRADLASTEKLLAAGEDVQVFHQVAIVHKMTGHPLYADMKNKQPTDFGIELEACAYAARAPAKHHNLGAEAIGTRTPDTEGRHNLPCNTWMFILANDPNEAKESQEIPAMASPSSVAHVIQQCLRTESIYAFRAFISELLRSDKRKTGTIDAEELKWQLKQHKLPLREEHFDLLIAAMDKKRVGYVQVRDILHRLRIPLSCERCNMIESSFHQLCSKAAGGMPTREEIVQWYDTTIDARVRSGLMSAEDALGEYSSLWCSGLSDMIQLQEFVDCYSDVATSVENDRHFQQLLEESWR